jgi:hypothetical protein
MVAASVAVFSFRLSCHVPRVRKDYVAALKDHPEARYHGANDKRQTEF